MTSLRARVALLFGLCSLFACLFASPAWARGVKIDKATIEEDPSAHNWKLKLSIDFGSAPDRDIVPMVFSFKQTATYERSLTDETGDKPVLHTLPMSNQVPNNSEQDVGFSDPGTGKRFPVTKFPITIRRKDDFEAGEYELTIKVVGGPSLGTVRLQLKGDNKVIDRRSMNFTGSLSPAKKQADPAAKGATEARKAGAAEDQGPDLSNIPDRAASAAAPDSSDDHAPPSVGPKQGGCGCELASASPPLPGSWAAALALGLAVLARRRRN